MPFIKINLLISVTTQATEDASSAPPVLPDPDPTAAPVEPEAEEVPAEPEVAEAEEPEETPAAEDPDGMDVKSTATHPLTSSNLATAVGTGVMLVSGRY